jgi:hypothetical protein
VSSLFSKVRCVREAVNASLCSMPGYVAAITPDYVLSDVNLAFRYLSQLTWHFNQSGKLRLVVKKQLGGFKSGQQTYLFPINRPESYKNEVLGIRGFLITKMFCPA